MTLTMSYGKDYHSILHVHPGASVQEMKEAYLRMKNLYQDTNQALYSLAQPDDLAQTLSEVEEAYHALVLSQPQAQVPQKTSPQEEEKPKFSFLERSTKKLHSPSIYNQAIQDEIPKLMAAHSQGDGALFQKIRELSQVSLEEMQEHIKVGMDHLGHIEQNRFECLPQPVYVKGFLKSYLSYLGVKNADQLVTAYITRLKQWTEKNHG
jgi:DnaJ-class molecular chaperone